MCKMKSFIITKDRVFVPEYDSHTKMLEELGIEDTAKNAATLFVRGELYPGDGDEFTPVKGWKFNVDQDILPEWFVKDYDKERSVQAVSEWAAKHIFADQDGPEFPDAAGMYFFKNCHDVTIETWGSSTVTIETWDSSTVTVTTWGSATAKVTTWGSSTAINIEKGSRSKLTFKVCNNSTFKDCPNKTIHQGGGWAVVNVG